MVEEIDSMTDNEYCPHCDIELTESIILHDDYIRLRIRCTNCAYILQESNDPKEVSKNDD